MNAPERKSMIYQYAQTWMALGRLLIVLTLGFGAVDRASGELTFSVDSVNHVLTVTGSDTGIVGNEGNVGDLNFSSNGRVAASVDQVARGVGRTPQWSGAPLAGSGVLVISDPDTIVLRFDTKQPTGAAGELNANSVQFFYGDFTPARQAAVERATSFAVYGRTKGFSGGVSLNFSKPGTQAPESSTVLLFDSLSTDPFSFFGEPGLILSRGFFNLEGQVWGNTNLSVEGDIDITGDENYVEVPDHPAMHLQEFTLELMFRPESPYGSEGGEPEHFLVSKKIAESGSFITNYALAYRRGGLDVVSGAISFEKGEGIELVSPVAYPPSQWHHAALVLDRDVSGVTDRLTLYVNGQVAAEKSGHWPQLQYTAEEFLIGAGNFSGSASGRYRRNFNGLVDDVRLSSAALTPDQFIGLSDIGTPPHWPEQSDLAITSIAAGARHSVVVSREGTLWAWGRNVYGQLGDGSEQDRTRPVRVDLADDWHAVSAGANHTLGLRTDGSLWAWGRNRYGELGIGSDDEAVMVPSQIGSDYDWRAISAGHYHSIAIKADGSLWAWGANDCGQLGDGTTDDRYRPVRIGVERVWKTVSAGGVHTVALKKDGSLWGWGRNAQGELGLINDKNDHWRPIQADKRRWKKIDAGAARTMALLDEGQADHVLRQWGLSLYFINIPSTEQSTIDVIEDSEDWVDIAIGGHQNFVMKANGSLWAWGRRDEGQFGDATSYDGNPGANAPKDWVTIEAGWYHVLALKRDGSLWAWGRSAYGEVGNGSKDTSNIPPTRLGMPQEW